MLDNCPGCNSSSTTYSRCNPPISSNCTFYKGENKQCETDTTFSICNGDNLTSIQALFFDKICALIGKTDISEITIPSCLEAAWNNNDVTILNVFTLLLQNACDLQAQITNVSSELNTVDPVVNICLSCCTEEGDCNGVVNIQLSAALNKIVECICNLKAQVNTLQTQVDVISNSYTGLQDQLTTLTNFNATQVLLNIQLQQDIAGIKCGLDGAGIPYNC